MIAFALSLGCSTNHYVVGYQVIGGAAAISLDAQRAWKDADKAKEKQILDETKFREDSDAALAKWRETSSKVDLGFTALTEALAAAYRALAAAEQAKGTFDAAKWVQPAYRAALAIKAALDAGGVRVPGVDEILALAGRLTGVPAAANSPSER